MDSLKKIESLPSARRSSFIGQAGVLVELRALDAAGALQWLEDQLASPVSRDWGRLLYSLNATPTLLRHWLGLSKEHALAAADAAELLATAGELDSTCSLLPDLRVALDAHQSPRLAAAVKAVELAQAATSSPLPIALERAASLLSNNEPLSSSDKVAIVGGQQPLGPWHALFHALSEVYCIVTLDWRASSQDQLAAVKALPVWQQAQQQLLVESVDFGNDEIILIALSKEQMAELKRLAPPIKFAPALLAA
jgi:hypothetical protein